MDPTKRKYQTMLKSELLRLCSERKLKCSSQMTKSKLIEVLLAKPKLSIKGMVPVIKTLTALARKGDDVSMKLRGYLRLFDWTGFETLKSQVEELVEVSKPVVPKKKKVKKIPKTVPKKIPRAPPGIYKSMDILSISFGKKGEVPKKSSKTRERISITLDELRKEVNNPAFIKSFTKSSKDLMKAKALFYTRRLEDAKKEYTSLHAKVRKLQAAGISDTTINDMYPGHSSTQAFVVDLQDLIDLVQRKGASATEETIKEGLIRAIDDPDEGISSLVGRNNVKDQIASQLYSFSKGYKTFLGSFNNIEIKGSAGVGKTALAKVIGFAFSNVGILAKDTVKIVTRAELVGEYIGQTAPRTRSVLIQSLEGVLFIDEAPELTRCPGEKSGTKDFGSEAITELVNFLDKYIGMNIVIVAGYEDLMTRCFMTFNEGLPRRFPYRYILSPYSDSELTDILVNNLRRKIPKDILIDEETSNFLYSMLVKIRTEIPETLKNQAGDMLNLSAQLNKAITGAFKIKWKNKDLAHNIPILLSGFDDFLSGKGYSVYD